MADDFVYQGKPIDEFLMVFRGLGRRPCADAAGDKPLHIDDVVRVCVEGRVVGSHTDTDKDGRVVQTAVISPIEVNFDPWDKSDPHDDGVIRSNRVLGP